MLVALMLQIGAFGDQGGKIPKNISHHVEKEPFFFSSQHASKYYWLRSWDLSSKKLI